MELLNPHFVLLIVRITVSVLPGVLGVYLLSLSDERKREMRNHLCNRLFGVSNAIAYPKFERFLMIAGIVCVVLSVIFAWFLLIAGMIGEPA